jgi:UDP-N-acetylmuramoyl-tripeptide--D-alanyl-D-alanine ligase
MRSYFTNDFKITPGTLIYIAFKVLIIYFAFKLLASTSIIPLAVILADLTISLFISLKIFQDIFARRFQIFKKSIRNILIFIPVLILILLPYIAYTAGAVALYRNDSLAIRSGIPLTQFENFGGDLNKYFEFQNNSDSNLPPYDDIRGPVIPITLLVIATIATYNSIIYLLSFGIVSLGVLVTHPLAMQKRNKLIKTAREKISRMSELKTIGITGSYGKTSTKEMLVKILSQKYKVGYTKDNMNTEVGVAISVMDNLPEDSEIFVMEAGAYRKGEIRNCVNIVPLDFAIVTNVGKAHLDIFKTVENIAETKSELIQGLKPRGKAVLNFDNSYTRNMSKLTTNESFLYHVADETDYSAQAENNLLCIYEIEWNEPNVKFKIKFKEEELDISTRIVGKHQLKNLAAAILCTNLAGMSLIEIKHHIERMTFESSHFRIYEGKSGIKIIDDGYNSNPEGFTSALSHLKMVNTKNRILISKGIPEIGKEIKNVYAGLAGKIYDAANIFITSDRNFYEALNAENLTNFEIHLIEDNDKIKKFLKNYLNKDSTILIEGRIHPKLKDYICA